MTRDYEATLNYIEKHGLIGGNHGSVEDDEIFDGVQATIRHALRFAEKMMKEPSEGFPSMCQVGAAKIWDECKEGLIGHGQAKAVFTAMRDQALKELGE